MRLRQLFESKGSVAIIFGRFNPPHKGHKAAWQMASKHPYWYVGTNQSTQGPKDPLPFDVKVQAMTAIWPEVEGHIVAETSWLTLASKVYEEHGDVTLFCLTDEDWVTKTIVQYNGKEGPHGYYNFPNIKQQPTPRLSSATALRDAVASGSRDAFAHAAGVSAETDVAGHPFFDLVAHYLMPYLNAPKKAPKKAKAKDAEVGEARQSAAVKLQKAFQREQEKSAASRKRGEEVMAQAKKDAEQKQQKESAPEGWEGTVKAMKKHKDIDNPWALAHWMKNKGMKSHKK